MAPHLRESAERIYTAPVLGFRDAVIMGTAYRERAALYSDPHGLSDAELMRWFCWELVDQATRRFGSPHAGVEWLWTLSTRSKQWCLTVARGVARLMQEADSVEANPLR